jgi:amino acid permease
VKKELPWFIFFLISGIAGFLYQYYFSGTKFFPEFLNNFSPVTSGVIVIIFFALIISFVLWIVEKFKEKK